MEIHFSLKYGDFARFRENPRPGRENGTSNTQEMGTRGSQCVGMGEVGRVRRPPETRKVPQSQLTKKWSFQAPMFLTHDYVFSRKTRKTTICERMNDSMYSPLRFRENPCFLPRNTCFRASSPRVYIFFLIKVRNPQTGHHNLIAIEAHTQTPTGVVSEKKRWSFRWVFGGYSSSETDIRWFVHPLFWLLVGIRQQLHPTHSETQRNVSAKLPAHFLLTLMFAIPAFIGSMKAKLVPSPVMYFRLLSFHVSSAITHLSSSRGTGPYVVLNPSMTSSR